VSNKFSIVPADCLLSNRQIHSNTGVGIGSGPSPNISWIKTRMSIKQKLSSCRPQAIQTNRIGFSGQKTAVFEGNA